MKIGIDARFYGPIGKGLGRYTQKLIEHLEKIDKKNEYVIFLRKENFNDYIPKNPRFRKVLADIHWYTLEEQIYIPKILFKERLDLMHFPHFNVPILYTRPFVLTLHDLILLRYPTVRATTRSALTYWIKFFAYRLLLRVVLLRSRHIVTVSNFTKHDIVQHFKVKKERVSVTYEAASVLDRSCKTSSVDNEGILQRYGILKPYALYVGNAYPHKNLERLIRAFMCTSLTDTQLVLVGKTDHFYERVKNEVTPDWQTKIVFTGHVSDSELERLYANTRLYVFPSLYEGFGLPPLEAMMRGVPVVSSDRSSMPEILGDAALYFNPEDESDMQEKLTQAFFDDRIRRTLVTAGRHRVKQYSWKKMAEETLLIYKKYLK